VSAFTTSLLQFFALGIAVSALGLTGCPDYSHLKQVPDYKNMTDSASENESVSDNGEISE